MDLICGKRSVESSFSEESLESPPRPNSSSEDRPEPPALPIDKSSDLSTTLDENIYQRETSGFAIILRERVVVHGTWDPAPAKPGAPSSSAEQQPEPGPPSSSPKQLPEPGPPSSSPKQQRKASLLGYRVELHSDRSIHKRRFKFVSLKFRLEHVGGATVAGGKDQDLYVVSFSPAQQGSIVMLPTTVTHNKEKETSMTIEVSAQGGAPVTPKLAHMQRDKASEAWLQHARVTIQGHALKTRRHRKGDDRVEWTISENPKEATIPDSYDLAILLRRPTDDSKFKIVFELKVNVDWWHDLKDMNPFKGWRANGKVYDPKDEKEQKREDKVKTPGGGLRDLSHVLHDMKNYSSTHLPEEFKP